LLAPLFLASSEPSVLGARLLGAALGPLAVLGVMGLGWQLFSLRVAILAGALGALYPGAIGTSIFVLSEAAFCPLLVGQLICWTGACQASHRQRSLIWSAATGVVAGLATLVRPSWILFTPLAAGVALALGGRWRRDLAIGATVLAALVLTLLPWWMRNLRVTGTFVLTTLETGASFYDGLNPAADGGSNMEFMPHFRELQEAEDAARTAPSPVAPEVRLDRRLRGAAIAWAREHPRRVLELMAIKFWRMWSPWPHAAELSGWPFRLAVACGYLPLLICGLWGGWRNAGRGWPYLLGLLPAAYFTALHMIFASSIRYREPVMLLLTVYAAAALDSLWARHAVRRRAREGAPAAADISRRTFPD
jgi:4-amino-4-deoxy-L-arabinose transferase-like glycosyltransferase